jgi:hypothetical protein
MYDRKVHIKSTAPHMNTGCDDATYENKFNQENEIIFG